jgi:hypothetical protein
VVSKNINPIKSRQLKIREMNKFLNIIKNKFKLNENKIERIGNKNKINKRVILAITLSAITITYYDYNKKFSQDYEKFKKYVQDHETELYLQGLETGII